MLFSFRLLRKLYFIILTYYVAKNMPNMVFLCFRLSFFVIVIQQLTRHNTGYILSRIGAGFKVSSISTPNAGRFVHNCIYFIGI